MTERPRKPAQLALGIRLHNDATFENFQAGANGAALAALKAACAGQGEDRLLLWGAPECGLSHLLQAACHRASALGRSSLYLPLGSQSGLRPAVFEALESIDLICLDDVQALAGDALWEEALFHLCNRAQASGSALVLGAKAPPRQLAVKLADLSSRLAGGLVYQLQPLDDDGKQRLLQLRAGHRGLQLGEDTARFILNRSPRGLNALFSLLEQLDRASLQAQRRLTIPFVKEVLGW